MNKRIATAVAAGTAAALPLLTACGAGAAPESSAPATASAAVPSATSAPTASTAPSSSPSGSPSPSADPAKQTRAVQAASEKFVTTVLTIGYPDKTYDDYLARVKPLMTDDGYGEVKASSGANAAKTLKKLYAAKTRSVPKVVGDVKVTRLGQAKATSKLSFRSRVQTKVGAGYRTVKTSSKETVTLSLVDEGGRWLVDSAE